MALDNAQFIAELSITDPPGSDPLSQGDDQIRTIKRATFQSFPNIDAAVTLTTAQMNLAAIKNEANVFTAAQTISKTLTLTMPSAVGDSVSIFWKDFTGGVNRWELVEIAEDGTSPLRFGLVRYDALGAFASAPWVVDAADGIVQFDHVPLINGDPIWSAGEIKMLVQGATLPSTNWFSAIGTNGTVDLRDRILAGQGVFFGTQTPFLDAQTTVGPNVGNTGLSEAQIPSHRHRLRDLQTGGGISDGTALSAANSVGSIRNVTANIFTDASLSGNLVENTGSGNTHSHTIPELEVETAGLDAFQVMPYTYFMQVIQYVP